MEEWAMSKKYNPGTVDTNRVMDNTDGVTSSRKRDGTIHNTAYDKGKNSRLSWDENEDGITNVHSTRQEKNSHTDYKNGK